MFSRFTQKNVLRIYPKGTRVTSSNYQPHIGWMHGAQMVAFNMQVRFHFLSQIKHNSANLSVPLRFFFIVSIVFNIGFSVNL